MLSPPCPTQEPLEPIDDEAASDEDPEDVGSEDDGTVSGSEYEDSEVDVAGASPRPSSEPLFNPQSPQPTELESSPPKSEVIEIKDTPMKAELENKDVEDGIVVPIPKPELGVITAEESQDVAEPNEPSSSKGGVVNSKGWVDNFYSKLTATDEWKKTRLAVLTKQLAHAKKEMTAVIFDLH